MVQSREVLSLHGVVDAFPTEEEYQTASRVKLAILKFPECPFKKSRVDE